jgi:hypothetical protein
MAMEKCFPGAPASCRRWSSDSLKATKVPHLDLHLNPVRVFSANPRVKRATRPTSASENIPVSYDSATPAGGLSVCISAGLSTSGGWPCRKKPGKLNVYLKGSTKCRQSARRSVYLEVRSAECQSSRAGKMPALQDIVAVAGKMPALQDIVAVAGKMPALQESLESWPFDTQTRSPYDFRHI